MKSTHEVKAFYALGTYVFLATNLDNGTCQLYFVHESFNIEENDDTWAFKFMLWDYMTAAQRISLIGNSVIKVAA